MQRTNHFTRFLSVGLALALTIGVAGFAAAQYDNGTATTTTTTTKADVSGTVVTSTSSSLSIRTDDGSTMTFSRDATSFVPATLKPGDRIRVSYGSATDGGQLVSSVTLLPMSTTSTTTTNSTYPSSTTRSSSSSMNDELPRTASPIGAIGLLGLVSLGIGLMLRKPAATAR